MLNPKDIRAALVSNIIDSRHNNGQREHTYDLARAEVRKLEPVELSELVLDAVFGSVQRELRRDARENLDTEQLDLFGLNVPMAHTVRVVVDGEEDFVPTWAATPEQVVAHTQWQIRERVEQIADLERRHAIQNEWLFKVEANGFDPGSVTVDEIRYGNEVCHICGEGYDPANRFELDHIVPIDRGGSNDSQNLAVAHRSCNRRKGAN